MAYAPTSTYFAPAGDSSIIGQFAHADSKLTFEYSRASEAEMEWAGAEFDAKVWLPFEDWRLAKVLKTVAHVVVDEDAEGKPVVEKWPLRRHNIYPRP